ncbi:DUF2274 domain-containing protein [Leptolyngbya sp. 15MV]|nr:DUF2274 domain-containing protein [Leptolyngbya sp. 15MV]
MPKLKLGPILDDRPVKFTVELPAGLHRDLVAYAEALSRETGQQVEPAKLVAPMLARFLASDRGFRSMSRRMPPPSKPKPQPLPPPGEPGS